MTVKNYFSSQNDMNNTHITVKEITLKNNLPCSLTSLTMKNNSSVILTDIEVIENIKDEIPTTEVKKIDKFLKYKDFKYSRIQKEKRDRVKSLLKNGENQLLIANFCKFVNQANNYIKYHNNSIDESIAETLLYSILADISGFRFISICSYIVLINNEFKYVKFLLSGYYFSFGFRLILILAFFALK